MKLKNLFFAVMATAALLVGCEKPEVVSGEAKVTLDPETLTVPQAGGIVTVEVTATRDWNMKYSTEWISDVTPGDGVASNRPQKVAITVASNEGKNRTAQIRFRAGVASATLTIVQEGPGGEDKPIEEGDGTKEKPYNASQAHAIAAALADGASASAPCYIKGKIHKLHSKHTDDQIKQYGNGSFYISDDGQKSDNDFLCYQVMYLGNAKFTSADQVKVGDEVMIYGTITNYGGTCETKGQGSAYICELNGTFDDGKGALEKAESKTVAEFIAAADKNTYYKLTGKVSSYKFGNYMTFDLTDDTGKIYIYQVLNETEWKDKIKDGGTVTLAGKYDIYNGTHEVKSGQILSFNEYQGKDITTSKVSEAAAASDGDNVTLNDALVVANSAVGYLVTDATGNDYIFVYYEKEATETIPAVGDKVNIKAVKKTYADKAQLTNPATTIVSNNNTVNRPAAQDITPTFDSFTSTSVKFVSFTGKLTVDKEKGYYNVAVTGATKNIGCFIKPSFDVDSLDGVDGIAYTGYYIYTTSGKYIYLILTSASAPDGPYFIVNPASANVPAAGGSVEISISGNVKWNATVDNSAFTLSAASGEGVSKLTVTCPENTAFEARTAKVTVSTQAEVTKKSYEISIKQAAATDPDATVIELTKEQIIEVLTAKVQSSGFASKYQDFSFTVDGYLWSGNMNISVKNGALETQYLQIRNSLNAHILTPEFSSDIAKIEISAYATVSGASEMTRKLYAVPVSTNLNTESSSQKFNAAMIENAYGFTTFKGKANVELTETIDLSASSVKQVKLASYDGALYIYGIKVFLK